MYRRVLTSAASLAALLMTSASASASASTWSGGSWTSRFFDWCWGDTGDTSSRVPEIDASTGLLALATLGAALALAWEVKRRSSRP
ncbi:VPEID-CTERM sorting domain-containing protein [Antarcticimicrobium luteum]|nr:VPEID-CTERM sorting domain-containing protein [Antarcticimicrobium luteum]